MKCILLFLVVIVTVSVPQAERIDGPANIRQQPKGEVIFSLHDNVDVETSESVNGWFQVLITAKISQAQYETNPTVLKKGTKLFNMKGEEIGIAVQDITVAGTMSGGGAVGNPKWYAAEVLGIPLNQIFSRSLLLNPSSASS